MSLIVKRTKSPVINVIPLIDVMVVLIIFLLLTTHFDDPKSMNITPPAAESAAKAGDTEATPIVLAVDKAGALFLNSAPVARDAVEAALRDVAKRAKNPTVLVVADEAAPTKDTVFALDKARVAGLPTRLVTRGK